MGFKLDCLVELKFHGRLNFHLTFFIVPSLSVVDQVLTFAFRFAVFEKSMESTEGGSGRQSLMSPLKREKIVSGVPYGRRLLSSVHFGIFLWRPKMSATCHSSCLFACQRTAKVAWPAVNLAEKWRRWNGRASMESVKRRRCWPKCGAFRQMLSVAFSPAWSSQVGYCCRYGHQCATTFSSPSTCHYFQQLEAKMPWHLIQLQNADQVFFCLPRYLLHNSKLLVKRMSVNRP